MNDKELLLRDLCGRLPYGVKCKTLTKDLNDENILYEDREELTIYRIRRLGNEYMTVVPYLFPMDSMTAEQKNEYNQLLELELKAINDEIPQSYVTAFEVDFYNKYHLDWRGLITKGLAIDATGLNIY